MNPRPAITGSKIFWDIVILATSAIVILLNMAGLILGVSTVFPHLLYIPVVLAAYKYPKWGFLFACCVGALYLGLVFLFAGENSVTVLEALVRVVLLVVIGGLISFLTKRLHEQESLYRGLFDHSEAGSILVREDGGARAVEEVSERASSVLQRSPEEMKGIPLASFWSAEEEEKIFSRLAHEGKVYAAETTFRVPDGGLRNVLLSVAKIPENRASLTFVDITRRVNAEQALKTANDKLSLLARISADHLHRTTNEIIETVDEAASATRDEPALGMIERIRALAWSLARQLFLTETYKDLGTSPPEWMSVQRILESAAPPDGTAGVSRRFWAERLEVYADPLFQDVLSHIVENSVRHGGTIKNLVVVYHETLRGLDLIIQDDGVGIPQAKKEKIFEYDAGGHAGIGLFICRQILEVTGMTIAESGVEGSGARFVIHIPVEGYRIEGMGEDAPPFPVPLGVGTVGFRGVRHKSGLVRELVSAEFPLAEELWIDYHQTKGDVRTDRIFATFSEGIVVSIARCKRHPDGFEVDGVFTPDRHRGHGYANAAVWGLVEACGNDTLYMHSVKNLIGFYGHYGFVPIHEKELPTTIRERFAWAQGEMEGANVAPMKREPT
jgi:PAS domain S-box-containing protein